MFDVQEELKKLPQKPGVYIMRDSAETVIYVGKAINLKNRVRNYFQASNADVPKIKNILANIERFEYIVTDTEIEALILECTLIKQYMPKYNVLLKDDKSYPYIKVTTIDEFPKVFSTRTLDKDGSKYFGPYTSAYAVAETMELIHTLWPLRTCNKKIIAGEKNGRACLNYHIGQCTAPCSGNISKEEYHKMTTEVLEFLNGKHEEISRKLQQEMLAASDVLDFEKAAGIRDKIFAVKKLEENQKLDRISSGDQDIVAFARAHDEALFQVFFIRDGKMTGREHFMMNGVDSMTREAVMTEFITQFYSGTPFVPRELILQTEIDDKEIIMEWLEKERGHKVMITIPKIGEKLKLVNLAANNAIITLEQFGEQIKRDKKKTEGALLEIREALGIECSLERIEAYDISNIQGFESVGSMVVFEGGKPKRSDYRKFKIKTVKGANDFASMQEVLTRRLNRYEKERSENAAGNKAKFSKLPDILFMDGGKAQITAAEGVLNELNIHIPVCGMIKDDRHRTRGLLYDGEEVLLPHTSEGFKLITRIQDEVHRFAIEYHRKLRAKTQVRSLLDDIAGIGETRRRTLMKHFGSIDGIRAAEIVQLQEVDGMNIKAAEAVYKFFHM